MTSAIADDRIIIEGVMEDNKKFRPSDWAERISEMLASFGPDHKLHYSEFVHPCIISGSQCLVVNRRLSETHPDAFEFILQFASKNKLRIQEDRRVGQKNVEVDRRNQQPVIKTSPENADTSQTIQN
jgi:hypothetical protein